MTIRWTDRAIRDLESVHEFVSEHRPGMAPAVVDQIASAIDSLTRHPEMGRQGRVTGTRELVVAPFVVAYKLRRGAVEVLAIVHGARRWPDSF
jgi:addiction module RelE/StbE family toxin